MATDELIDVLDEQGNKTGVVLPMSEVHKRELWDPLSFVWIYNDEAEVIVQKRAADSKSYPDMWDVSAGGHPSAGETWEEGAVKEAGEEVGLQISENNLEYIGEGQDVHATVAGTMHRGYYKLYLVHYTGDKNAFTAQNDEVSAIEWRPVVHILEDRKYPEKSKQYTARDEQIYENALNKILERVH